MIIRQIEDFREAAVVLCEGDLQQAKILREGSSKDYLIMVKRHLARVRAMEKAQQKRE